MEGEVSHQMPDYLTSTNDGGLAFDGLCNFGREERKSKPQSNSPGPMWSHPVRNVNVLKPLSRALNKNTSRETDSDGMRTDPPRLARFQMALDTSMDSSHFDKSSSVEHSGARFQMDFRSIKDEENIIKQINAARYKLEELEKTSQEKPNVVSAQSEIGPETSDKRHDKTVFQSFSNFPRFQRQRTKSDWRFEGPQKKPDSTQYKVVKPEMGPWMRIDDDKVVQQGPAMSGVDYEIVAQMGPPISVKDDKMVGHSGPDITLPKAEEGLYLRYWRDPSMKDQEPRLSLQYDKSALNYFNSNCSNFVPELKVILDSKDDVMPEEPRQTFNERQTPSERLRSSRLQAGFRVAERQSGLDVPIVADQQGPIDPPATSRQQVPGTESNTKLKLDESNIIDKFSTTVDTLSLRRRQGHLTREQLRGMLTRLFTRYTTGDTDDSVFHVLARLDTGSAVQQARNFINVLKTSEVDESIVLNLTNINFETPLHIASRQGLPMMCEALLSGGASINITDSRNNSPIHLAVGRCEGAMEVLDVLQRYQPSLTIFNEDGFTALHLAVSLRKSDITSSLIIKSERHSYCSTDLINVADRKHGNTPLHIAVDKRFKEVVNLLLNFDDRIDVNIKNSAGKTPLAFVMEATDAEAKDILEILTSKKADPSLVEILEPKKEECKSELDSDEERDIVEKDDELDSESAYHREWEDNELFDAATVSKLCPVLDQGGDWRVLLQRLNYLPAEIEYCGRHWSPSLMAFNMAVRYKPEVTADVVRQELLKMNEEHVGAQYIQHMLIVMLEQKLRPE